MNYQAVPAIRSEEPLLLGMIGPPGGGKSLSSLKIARGIQSVRGGDIVMIDTERGRSRKYSDAIPFKIVEMEPDACSTDFLEAIRAQLPSNPAAIIVDSLSDEHERYLAWHDEMVPKMGNNEWAAWAKPKAARKVLISGILKIKTPLIFTFRAREKTKQDVVNGKKVVTNIGWQPVAPLEIVHTLDLTCILPPRADGVPVWKSDKIGEDFIIKLPSYLAPYVQDGKQIDENMGAAFARWAKGDSPAITPAKPAASPSPAQSQEAAGNQIPSAADYYAQWQTIISGATNDALLSKTWNDQAELRKHIEWTDEHPFKPLQKRVKDAVEASVSTRRK